MNKITVTSLDASSIAFRNRVRRYARETLRSLEKDFLAADIFLVSDATIRALNRKFRKKDKPTNVLSFCNPPKFVNAPSRYKYLGEIYIDRAYIKRKRQSERHMVVHGLLHLLGYDHETARERAVMERKERSLLGDRGSS